MINKIFELTDQEFIKLIKDSTCIKEVLFKLGYSTVGNGWGYSKVKERMSILGLDGYSFKGKSPLKKGRIKSISPDKLFTKNNKHARCIVRNYILTHNLLEYKCAICGISEWNGKKLSLELDHINGCNNDHRLENLRFLCPNCHSQTSTYGSKNSNPGILEYNITDEIKKEIETSYLKLKNIKKVSKETGYKQKVIREVINILGLTRSNLRFVIRYDKNMNEICRYGSISETCQSIIDNNECKTKKLKTCKNTFLRNCDKFWLNSYWKILDA